MPFPQTRAQMVEMGYKPGNRTACRGCGLLIEWWRTPHNARMPMNLMDGETAAAVSHWATCTHANNFRQPK
jgi:hypothetical protein